MSSGEGERGLKQVLGFPFNAHNPTRHIKLCMLGAQVAFA